MDKARLGIATISLVRNPDEEQLLRRSLTLLSSLNIPVYVTDGGSSESFLSFVNGLLNFHLLEPVKGLWAQAENSLLAAAKKEHPFILYTEPDKALFFEHHLPRMLDEIAVDERTGIYMASRSLAAFQSFPAFQQMTETTINNCCAELIGLDADYVYGPFLLNNKVVAHLKNLEQATIGWGWRPYAFNLAKRLQLNIQSYVGDFYCPEDQRDDDTTERIYRMKQMTQNIEGLLLSTTAPL